MIVVQMIVMPRSLYGKKEETFLLDANTGNNLSYENARLAVREQMFSTVQKETDSYSFINLAVMDIEALKEFYGQSLMATEKFTHY